MDQTTRQTADRFLRETYGFDEETRNVIIGRGLGDIARNCRELRRILAEDGPGEPARRLAHRLKGNLRALGLTALAALAQAVEVLAQGGDREALAAAARELWWSLAEDQPPV